MRTPKLETVILDHTEVSFGDMCQPPWFWQVDINDICVMCIYIYIFVYVNPKVRFITNHIIPHCFVSADCSITCGFLRSQFVRSAVISSSSLLGAGMTLTDQQCLGAGPQGTCHESWNFSRFPAKTTPPNLWKNGQLCVFHQCHCFSPSPAHRKKDPEASW